MGKNYYWNSTDEQHFSGRSLTPILAIKILYKMPPMFFALLMTVTPLLLHAQPRPADPPLVPAWTRQYDSFSRSEDVYIVSKGDKKGVVSLAGKQITKLVYDTILPFAKA
jgi:hypothetical protein